jgi:hypothetical protein
MIDHVRADNAEEISGDTTLPARTLAEGKLGSARREQAPTVQFSARISPELKKRLDRWTNGGELSYAQTLERMLDELEQGAIERQAEIMRGLQAILARQAEALTLLSDLAHKRSDHDPRPEAEAPDPFAFLDVSQQVPPPLPEAPVPSRKSWWRRP